MRLNAAICVLLASAACSKNDSTGPGNTTGSLSVTITAPAGVTANVVVSGPNNYSQNMSATQTLSGLAPGSYVVNAIAATTADPIVGVPYSGAVTGSPASVTAGGSANATVTYTQRANEGLLWLTSIVTSALSGYTSTQLAAGGTPTPAHTISQKTSRIAVDGSGGAWVTFYSRDTLYYFTQAQLLAGGAPAPTVKINTHAGSLSQPTGLAFDAQGDLWVANRASNTIVEYTPAQLAATGAPTPAVTIETAFQSLATPWDLAFDAQGDLWVANFSDSTVVGYSPDQLVTGGPIFPVKGISNTLGGGVFGLAFDAAGNLWVASLSNKISKFTPNQLTGLGAPAPTVVITLNPFAGPSGIAFDASGNMWVADQFGGGVRRLTVAQLATSGTVTAATVVNSGGQPVGLAFSPHAANLPVH